MKKPKPKFVEPEYEIFKDGRRVYKIPVTKKQAKSRGR